jgi:hypothetical protein
MVSVDRYTETFGVFMAAAPIRDEGQTLGLPTGKLLGIVETKADLETLLERVDRFFFSDIAYFSGEPLQYESKRYANGARMNRSDLARDLLYPLAGSYILRFVSIIQDVQVRFHIK